MIFRRKSKVREEEKEDLLAGKKELDIEEKKSSRRKKEDVDQYIWDKKRIIIALGMIIVLFILAGEIKNRFYPDVNILGESTTKKLSQIEKPDVRSPNLNLGDQVNTSLEDVKSNIENIDPADVASSSPQIQKVLRDIQGLKNLPTDKARDACFRICEGI
jgi:hypothetical protein